MNKFAIFLNFFLLFTNFSEAEEVIKIFGDFEKKEIVFIKREPDYIYGFHSYKIENYLIEKGNLILKKKENLISNEKFFLLKKNGEIELYTHFVEKELKKKQGKLLKNKFEAFKEVDFEKQNGGIEFEDVSIKWQIQRGRKNDILKIIKKDEKGRVKKIIKKIPLSKVSGQLKDPTLVHIERVLKIFHLKGIFALIFQTETPLPLYHPPLQYVILIE